MNGFAKGGYVMKFSLKAEYGLRALIELALINGEGLIGAKEIASRQGLPARFLEQQVTALKKAGLVSSQRGAGGGCALAKEPSSISVLEVIEALDGPVINMDCLADGDQSCSQDSCCVVQELWHRSQVKLKDFLQDISIADLAKRHKDIQGSKSIMYYI